MIRSIRYFLKKLLVSKGKIVFGKHQCNSETWRITSLLPKLTLVKLMQCCCEGCPIYCVCKNEIPSHVFFDPVKKDVFKCEIQVVLGTQRILSQHWLNPAVVR